MVLGLHTVITIAVAVILLLIAYLWYSKRSQPKLKMQIRQEPVLGIDPSPVISNATSLSEERAPEIPMASANLEPLPPEPKISCSTDTPTNTYDPNTIIIQIRATPGRPFMGYELLQTLLANRLHFGDMRLFHRYEQDDGTGQLLFSLAAATKTGAFELNNMGAFSCGGLVMFMQLGQKKKLMDAFDLMLDTARQLIEDLGGEILDVNEHPVDASIIKQWREKICTFEEKNLYTADLLDNL